MYCLHTSSYDGIFICNVLPTTRANEQKRVRRAFSGSATGASTAKRTELCQQRANLSFHLKQELSRFKQNHLIEQKKENAMNQQMFLAIFINANQYQIHHELTLRLQTIATN